MLSLARLADVRPRVFPSHPRVEGYYPSAGSEEARARLVRCLERGEGPALLIGAPGVGKSSLLAVIAQQLAAKLRVASLTSAQLCTRRALLQSILFALGQPFREREEGELRLTLVDYLTRDAACAGGVALLIDEAQSLPQRLLEELRILGNLAPQGEARVRLLLAGGPQLEEMFAAPENEAFNQRVATRCYLAPMSHGDTVQYVRAHIAAAGGNADKLIESAAFDAMYHATSGIPRLLNQLADRALLLGAEAGMTRLDRAAIQTAWSDLQQLPSPWNMPDAVPQVEHHDDVEHGQVVEFGPLSDDLPTAAIERLGKDLGFSTFVDLDELELMPLEEAPIIAAAPMKVITPPQDVIAASVVPAPKSIASAARHPAANPFAETFDEEELVIEPFASFESLVGASQPLVMNRVDGGATSRQLAEFSAPLPPQRSPLKEDPAASQAKAAHAGLCVFDREMDEALRTDTELDDADELDFAPITTPVAPRVIEADNDDDLLVVESEVEGTGRAAIQRQDYRQLFASLRRG